MNKYQTQLAYSISMRVLAAKKQAQPQLKA